MEEEEEEDKVVEEEGRIDQENEPKAWSNE